MNGRTFSIPQYYLSSFQSNQESIDAAVTRGISCEKLEKFLVNFYTEQCRIINPNDVREVILGTLEKNILRPRQDLYLFILNNWLKHIFIPCLDPTLAGNIFIFGVGRIFSAYSNMGVQYCTDADINFVLRNTVSKAKQKMLIVAVEKLKNRIWTLFNIIVEVNASFTILKLKEIDARLAHTDFEARITATLFYKSNAGSYYILFDNAEIRMEVFKSVINLPDSLLFDNFLGNNPVKPTFSRLRDDIVKLSIISDGTMKETYVDAVIGAKNFIHNCRHLAAIHPVLYPPQWWFSMKYTVNRVYDYVSAMLNVGYSLKDLGFSGVDDPDYYFICQSSRLMLFFQELIHIKLDSFNGLSDYTYISAERFTSFMNLPKGSFRRDFDRIVLSPNFLHENQRRHYRKLKKAIHEREELHLSLTNGQEIELINLYGFTFHNLDTGSGVKPVNVPYTWGGLGYFVFSSVEKRLASVVDTKLIPTMKHEPRLDRISI